MIRVTFCRFAATRIEFEIDGNRINFSSLYRRTGRNLPIGMAFAIASLFILGVLLVTAGQIFLFIAKALCIALVILLCLYGCYILSKQLSTVYIWVRSQWICLYKNVASIKKSVFRNHTSHTHKKHRFLI